MSQKTLAALAAAALLKSSAIAQESEAAQQPEPLRVVTLLDIAELRYDPAVERLADWDAWPASWNNDFFLVVDNSGTPVLCEPFDMAQQSDLSARLCGDLVANARLEILKGFSLGDRHGIVALSKEPFTTLAGITLVDGSKPMAVPLSIKELAPQAFTDYSPLRSLEAPVPDVLTPRPLEVQPRYPSESLAEWHEGSVGTVVGVSAQGDVESCRPIETSGYGRLDNAACRYLLEHLKFDVDESATDGRPFYYYRQIVTFKIKD